MLLRGPERVHFVLDRQGVHARVYVPEGCGALRLYARFTTPEIVERLAAGDDRPPLEGLTLVKRVTLPWESIRRVRVWREGANVAVFPSPVLAGAGYALPAGRFAVGGGICTQKT